MLCLQDLGFSASDRAESVRRVGELSALFNDAGVITMVSLVSPYREDRDVARKRHEEQVRKLLPTCMHACDVCRYACILCIGM